MGSLNMRVYPHTAGKAFICGNLAVRLRYLISEDGTVKREDMDDMVIVMI